MDRAPRNNTQTAHPAGQYGALGHGTYEDKTVPTRVKPLVGKDIEKVRGRAGLVVFGPRGFVHLACDPH
jgi:hypothetical protein